MNKRTWLLGATALMLLSTAGLANEATHEVAAKPDSKGRAKNVILLIPDGYSAAYATNYRWYSGKEETALDQHLVGMMRTHSANSKVTDSAAAGTAMATGTKTNNGTISMDPNGKELTSILEVAHEHGKATGLVATSTITHATPAVFASHVASRASEADIAKQYMQDLEVDVLLGGGRKYFESVAQGGEQQEDLIKRAKQKGYAYATSAEDLTNMKANKLLGLFADDAMAPELDRETTSEPSLADMTAAALETLKRDRDGFFLMVEGSQIDWAGHAHDAAWAMKDAEAFHQAFDAAMTFAKRNKDTLVVVAGDHDTGGMSVGGYNEYVAKPEVLRSVKATGAFMVNEFNDTLDNIEEVVRTHTSLQLSAAEIQKIRTAAPSQRVMALNEVISQRAYVGWTTTQHTGVDVPLYAYGPQQQRFTGLLDNTDLPKEMLRAMKLN